MKDTYLLFDIGGTKTRVAASRNLKKCDEPIIFATPKNFKEGISKIKKIAFELLQGEKIKAASGGIAGPFDKKRIKLLNSPNLPDWAGKPLKTELEKAIGAPVYLENDSALVALGEARQGAGRGRKIVAYIAPGTGLGGARIINGKIDATAVGFEPGQQIINFDGKIRTLEEYVGGASVKKRFSKSPKEISDKKFWEKEAEILAYGLNNIAVLWSPEVIVLGGSMILGSPAIPIPRVQFHLKRIMKIFPPPEIKRAQLRDLGGLYGALEFLKQNTLSFRP